MPYTTSKSDGKVTVSKKVGGHSKVVGHTTPGKKNDYLAALHINSKDKNEGADVGQEFDNQVGDYYAVQRPYDGCEPGKLVHKVNPLQGVQGIGVEPVQIYGAYTEEKMAMTMAEKLHKDFTNKAMMLEKKKAEAAVAKTPYDELILQDKDPHYRVFNTTTDFDKDAITAYYHKSIGGYHGAKMRRYQELIEWQLGRNNMECVNMLNVKYFIVADSTNQKYVQQNPFTNGNAWFVKEYKIVNNADEEIVALNEDRNNPSAGFKSKQTAIIDKRFESEVKGLNIQTDTAASIILTGYAPNKLSYQSNASSVQLAVFSEIYYDKGWDVYIDGQSASHFRADYVLRALVVPKGKHTIEFKFEPKTIIMGEKIALASSAILYGSLIIILGLSFFASKKEESANQ
jgi:hypothetical protein